MLLICGGLVNIPNQSPIITLPTNMTPAGSEKFSDLNLGTIASTSGFNIDIRYTSSNREIRSSHWQNTSANYDFYILISLK